VERRENQAAQDHEQWMKFFSHSLTFSYHFNSSHQLHFFLFRWTIFFSFFSYSQNKIFLFRVQCVTSVRDRKKILFLRLAVRLYIRANAHLAQSVAWFQLNKLFFLHANYFGFFSSLVDSVKLIEWKRSINLKLLAHGQPVRCFFFHKSFKYQPSMMAKKMSKKLC
jgi:hypothetical protein